VVCFASDSMDVGFLKLGPIVHSMLAGCAGAQQFAFLKAVMDIIKTTVDTNIDGFAYWQTYVFIACAVLFAVIQIHVLNIGISKYNNVVFLPLYNSFLIACGILCGTWIYDEFKTSELSTEQQLLFGGGAAIQAVAIILMAFRPDPEEEDEEPAPLARRKSNSFHEAGGSDMLNSGVGVALLGCTPARSNPGSRASSRSNSRAGSRRSSICSDDAGGITRDGLIKAYGDGFNYGAMDNNDDVTSPLPPGSLSYTEALKFSSVSGILYLPDGIESGRRSRRRSNLTEPDDLSVQASPTAFHFPQTPPPQPRASIELSTASPATSGMRSEPSSRNATPVPRSPKATSPRAYLSRPRTSEPLPPI